MKVKKAVSGGGLALGVLFELRSRTCKNPTGTPALASTSPPPSVRLVLPLPPGLALPSGRARLRTGWSARLRTPPAVSSKCTSSLTKNTRSRR